MDDGSRRLFQGDRKWLRGFSVAAFAAGLGLIASVRVASASDDQATLSGVYLNYGGTSDVGLKGASGFGLRFQSERIKKGFRFTIGSQIETASGSGASASTKPSSVLAGQVLAGVTVSPFETAYVKPFLSLLPALGWVYWNDSDATKKNIGLSFGGDVGGGADIRASKGDKGFGIRLGTYYRIMRGSIGSVGTATFDAFILSAGILF